MILKDYYVEELSKLQNVEVKYSVDIQEINKCEDLYNIKTSDGNIYSSGFVLNSTYASVNQIHNLLGFEPFKIKYELCEIIICKVNDKLKNVGITVMDGPFFS